MEFIKLCAVFPGVGHRPQLGITKTIQELCAKEIWLASGGNFGGDSIFSFIIPVPKEDSIHG